MSGPRRSAGLLVALAFCGGLFGLEARAETLTFLTASSATGATTAKDAGNAKYLRVHGWRADSASAGVCTIYVQVSIDGTAWYRAATFANLTGLDATTGDGGDMVTVPLMPFVRLYVVGPLTGTFTVKGVLQR